jgi:hypothetical protein
MPVFDLTAVPWSVTPGSRLIFADLRPSASLEQIGRMETPELAETVVAAHNAELTRKKLAARGIHGSHGIQLGDGNSQTNVF